jgi:hypothetical protein
MPQQPQQHLRLEICPVSATTRAGPLVSYALAEAALPSHAGAIPPGPQAISPWPLGVLAKTVGPSPPRGTAERRKETAGGMGKSTGGTVSIAKTF